MVSVKTYDEMPSCSGIAQRYDSCARQERAQRCTLQIAPAVTPGGYAR